MSSVAVWLQGLDDVFMKNTPLMDFSDDLYDPTERQSINWTRSEAAAKPSGAEAAQGAAAAKVAEEEEGEALMSPDLEAAELASPPRVEKEESAVSMAESEGAVGVAAAFTAGAEIKPAAGVSAATVQLQNDAFLVFRALCKLSIRSVDGVPGSELTTIRGKVP
jgi:hypothetical protein